MDGELGFDLETVGHGREGFRETSRKDLVARQHVRHLAPEHGPHHAAEQTIAEAMAQAVRPDRLRFPSTVYEVVAVFDEAADKIGRAGRVIGRIAVDEHIDVGLDVGEHSADDIALAAADDAGELSAMGERDLRRPIAGRIVEDMNGGRGERSAKTVNDGADSALLIVAWDEDCDRQTGHSVAFRFAALWFRHGHDLPIGLRSEAIQARRRRYADR